MKKIRHSIFALIVCTVAQSQWTTPTSNEVVTTDEIVGPVLRISNEIRVPNTFSATDPTIGTLDNSHYGINLHKTNGIGFAFNGVHQMVFEPNGDTGIGTTSPQGRLHVSTGTSGDAVLRLEADTDNNDEYDNPMFQFRQDGDQVGINMGFSSDNFGHNIFGIGTRYVGQDSWKILAINTQNGNIGIGTTSPNGKLQLQGNDGEQVQGQIHIVGNGGPGNGDAYVSFYEGDEVNSKWSVGVKDGGNAFAISNGLTMDMAPKLVIKDVTGNVGVGTTSPDSKLTVKGNIHAEEVKVDLNVPAPDYVFKKEYKLKSLEEVQKHIEENGHLPNIPSAQEIQANGIKLGEMDMKLLEKIEELTLYILEQNNKINKILIEKDSLQGKVKENQLYITKLHELIEK